MVADNRVSRWKQNRKVIWSGSSVGMGERKPPSPLKLSFYATRALRHCGIYILFQLSYPLHSPPLCLASLSFFDSLLNEEFPRTMTSKILCFVKGECHGNEPVFIEIILNVKGKFTFFHFCIGFIDSDHERRKVQLDDWIS